MIEVPNPIVGTRVLLRPYRDGDGAALNEAVAFSLDHLKRWMPWAQECPTIEDSEEVVRKNKARWHTREDLTMGIWNCEETRVLGGSGLHRIDWVSRTGKSFPHTFPHRWIILLILAQEKDNSPELRVWAAQNRHAGAPAF
jgi:RimJ/RimL family protein N-acetyltransferase